MNVLALRKFHFGQSNHMYIYQNINPINFRCYLTTILRTGYAYFDLKTAIQQGYYG